MKIQLDLYAKAIVSLEQGLKESVENPHLLSSRDGAIQRFEYCFELSFNMMRYYISHMPSMDGEEAKSLTHPETVRASAEAGLVDDVKEWFAFREARNKTSHAYDPAIAEEVYSEIPRFLKAAKKLLARLQELA